MTEAAAIKEATAISEEALEAFLLIHRIANRALSAEERVGQRILRDPCGEINGLLVQMAVIEKLARAGLPKEGRELLDLAVAKEEAAAIRAEGRETRLELIPRPAHLSDAEAAVFRDVVGTADGGHFRPKDRELLSLYCAHVVQGARSDEAEAADGGAATGFACCHRADHVAVDEIATGAQEPDHRRAASAGLRASAKPGERRPWEEAEQEL